MLPPALLLLALAVTPRAAQAGGGWVPAPGASYLEISANYLSTARRYDAAGNATSFTRLEGIERRMTYRDASLSLFGEYGLGSNLALEGDLALRRVESLEPASRFATGGVGDLRLLLKRGFRAGPLAWAASLETRLPLGYDETDYPSLGSGHADVGAHLHAGYGAPWGYAQAEIGARARGGPPADDWPYAAQVGVMLSPRLQIVADARGNGLFESRADAAGDDATFDPMTASSRVAMGGPGLAWLPRPGLRIAAQAWRTWSGRNTPLGWHWKLAVARLR